MSITPDTKDWTWVLERRCPECGFDARTFDVESTGDSIRSVASDFGELLGNDRATGRPSPDVWSALEYSAHVRDVFNLYSERLHLMLTSDDPLYANWDQDEAAVLKNYGSEDPSAVTDELSAAAQKLARKFDGVKGAEWQRPGRRSDGVSFTIASFARYFMHDPIHHLYDIRKGYAALASDAS